MMQITSDDLYEFGQWARDHKDDLAPTSAWLLIERNNVARATSKGYTMTDDKASKIDKAMCALAKHNPRLGQVFTAHYVLGASYRDLAHSQKCSRTVVSKQITEASGFIIGAVAMIK